MIIIDNNILIASKMEKYLYEEMKKIYNHVSTNLKICISKCIYIIILKLLIMIYDNLDNVYKPPQSPVIAHIYRINNNIVNTQEWKDLDEYFGELDQCFVCRNRRRALECLEILQTKIFKISNSIMNIILI